MKQLCILLVLIFGLTAYGQNSLEWDGKYVLQFADFQAATTQIGGTHLYSLHTVSPIEFSFYMSSAEFMLTKNFNSKVNCAFNRGAASLMAPDSVIAVDLLHFARYEFDLSELYARKFRKRLFEQKGAFSNVNFIKPIYDEIQREFAEEHTLAVKATDLGRNREELAALHQEVLKEIEQLADFCKQCKPPKKRNKPS